MNDAASFHWRKTLLLKLIIAWIVLILPMSVLSLYSNTHEQTVIRNTILEQQKTNVAFYLDALEVEINRFQTIAHTYSQDSDFVRVATMKKWNSNYDRVNTILSIRSKLALVKHMSPFIENLYVMFPRLDYAINGQNADDNYDDVLAERLLMRKTLTNMVVSHEYELYVRAFAPPLVRQEVTPNLLIAIKLNHKQIQENLIKAAGEGQAALLGDDWIVSSVFFAEDKTNQIREIIGNSVSNTSSHQDKDHLYVWQTSERLGATLMISLPQRLVLQGLWNAERLLYLLIAMQCLCMILSVTMLYTSVHKPLRHMTMAFARIEQGDQDVRLRTDHQDEFQYLYAGFNHMMDQQMELHAQMLEQKVLSQQSQFKQLQMQINPHFFYNSFFAVRGMIEMGDTDTAVHMLECLGQYFRFITRSGQDTLPLEQEVMHARAYCSIQQIRFENIRVDFPPCPPTIRAVTVPRLILQPLIENAYVHGLEKIAQDCRLSVSFDETENEILITVENDGMENIAECMENIREKLSSVTTETTAILNIHRRLQLYYGAQAGIRMSKGEYGLQVTLVLLRGGINHD